MWLFSRFVSALQRVVEKPKIVTENPETKPKKDNRNKAGKFVPIIFYQSCILMPVFSPNAQTG
jgi:hypothetical protein